MGQGQGEGQGEGEGQGQGRMGSRCTSALAASPLVTSVKVTVIAECAWKVEKDGSRCRADGG